MRVKLPVSTYDQARVDLDPMEAWMERQLSQEVLTEEQASETYGNEPLQSNWSLLVEAMQLYCNSSHRPLDPYGRHGVLGVNYLSNVIGGSDAPPYWEAE